MPEAEGPFIKNVRTRRGRGVAPKADIVREVVWIKFCTSASNAGKGREGVKNPEHFVDVLYESLSLN